MRKFWLLALLLGLASADTPVLLIRNAGAAKGRASVANCTGAGLTCSVSNGVWILNASGGGGGSGLPSDPSACPGGQFVTDQDITGTLTCSAPPAQDWSVLTGKPSTFPATTPVATASALAGTPSTCSVGQAALGVTAAGNATGCWAPVSSAAGSDTQVQFNDGGAAFGASSTLLWDKTVYKLTLGTATGNDAIKFTTNGARLHLGSGTNDYLYSINTGVRTPGTVSADGGLISSTLTGAGAGILLSTDGNGKIGMVAGMGANSYGAILYTNNNNGPSWLDSAATGAGKTKWLRSGTGPSTMGTGFPTYQYITVADINATGSLSGTVFLRGDGTWNVPPGAYTLPAATSSTLGGVITPPCSTGNHYASVDGSGTLQCTADTAGGGGAPTTATYITQTADAGLSAEQVLSSLSTGLMKVTTGTGVISTAASGTDYAPATSGSSILKGNGAGGFSSAASGTDYGPPTSGNATGLVISTTATGAHTAYGGATCTNQFPRSLNASGAPTCASVDLSADTAATVLPMTKGGTGANITGTVGALHYNSSSTVTAQLADVAVGSALTSAGTTTVPAWSATGTCTSSATTSCTITGRRSGCLPVCSMTTSVSTTFRASISTTTITCTFGTSGTNTCNCICF